MSIFFVKYFPRVLLVPSDIFILQVFALCAIGDACHSTELISLLVLHDTNLWCHSFYLFYYNVLHYDFITPDDITPSTGSTTTLPFFISPLTLRIFLYTTTIFFAHLVCYQKKNLVWRLLRRLLSFLITSLGPSPTQGELGYGEAALSKSSTKPKIVEDFDGCHIIDATMVMYLYLCLILYICVCVCIYIYIYHIYLYCYWLLTCYAIIGSRCFVDYPRYHQRYPGRCESQSPLACIPHPDTGGASAKRSCWRRCQKKNRGGKGEGGSGG